MVIDVGAMHHAPEESTYALARLFRPEWLYAFDPFQDFEPGVEQFEVTTIVRQQLAAWVSDGKQSYHSEGMCSGVVVTGERVVETFDLARFILEHEVPVILKLDCEGAEYKLLPHLKETGADKLVEKLLVEWHPPHLSNGWYVSLDERVMPDCEIFDWNDLTGLETEAEKTPHVLT